MRRTAEEWDDYIRDADAEHVRLMAQDPNHPVSCCSDDCPECDSLGLMNIDLETLEARPVEPWKKRH